MRCGAVIPAAGAATRFGEDKTLILLHGKPVLWWVLTVLSSSIEIDQIVIPVSDRNRNDVEEIAETFSGRCSITLCDGGEERTDSVLNGVRSLAASCELVAVHDAARPLLTPDLLKSVVDAAREHGAAIPAVPVSDTIKRVANAIVVETLQRESLVAVQTPQVVRRDWIERAYDEIGATFVATDEASLIEAIGLPVHVVAGDPENIKITNPIDRVVAETILGRRVQQ